MKLLVLFLCTWVLAGTSANADEKAVSRCPIETGVFRDGGSQFMKIPAHGEQPSVEIILDRRVNNRGVNTTTHNKYFLAQEFQKEFGQPMKEEDVLRAFDQAEAVLLSNYGMEFIYHVAMNPLAIGANVSADEYEKKASDSKFMERIDISEVLWTIQQYRGEHRTEKVGSSPPSAEPAVKDQPSTPTPKIIPR